VEGFNFLDVVGGMIAVVLGKSFDVVSVDGFNIIVQVGDRVHESFLDQVNQIIKICFLLLDRSNHLIQLSTPR
jgi:hypothetical protein